MTTISLGFFSPAGAVSITTSRIASACRAAVGERRRSRSLQERTDTTDRLRP
ncbi:hypothetical protein ACFH04_08270 [Streptomyces noboritoensis]|uniref:Uncharacterized protein n=1 Tax=Streptomyces noboritoensis TaxID=67337 RepID=A0ABV6TD49_9ACTN